MKMDSIKISLPPSMVDYVREVVEREYGTTSEYFRELVRERQQKEIAADVALLEATHVGAPVGPTESEIMQVLKIQKKARKCQKARRSIHVTIRQ